jgi:hypothetical protein
MAGMDTGSNSIYDMSMRIAILIIVHLTVD